MHMPVTTDREPRISTSSANGAVILRYQNPSIRDFLHSVIDENSGEAALLIRGAIYF